MTDRKRLTRRDSLKGIAAAGTVVGGATFGLSTAMAHDEGDEKEDDHGNETGEDGKDDGKENGDEKEADEDNGKGNDGKDDEESDEKHGEKDDGKEYDGKEKDDEKDDSKEDGKHENGKDHDGKGDEDHDEEDHDGKDDGKSHDGKDAAKRIDLIPVCYETDGKKGDEKYGTFRVENHGKKDAKVGWERRCDGKRGDTSVAGGESAYFRVGLGNSGTATVSLYYDGKKIATADAETDTRCDCEE